jgi:3-phosphoshikimate 1-carboxyvinyltransferase
MNSNNARMRYRVIRPESAIHGRVKLPASKSISNRLLMMQALATTPMKIYNLSESEDTRVMKRAFMQHDKVVDIGHAGTAMRFLTVYFALKEGEWILTGSERMKNRPIGELVEALQQIGADIEYMERQGFPPLKIRGKKLKTGRIVIDGSISSQYISALIMIAPEMPNGLTIELKNQVISSSYIRLTLGLMEKMGVHSNWEGNIIKIAAQKYQAMDIRVEADWSAASYWYEIAALTNEAEILIEDLEKTSLQGDSVIFNLFGTIGVSTEFAKDGAVIRKTEPEKNFFEYDFLDNPDMVQTFVVSLAMLGIPFRLAGTQSLKIKETDRVTALQNEMHKLGISLVYTEPGILTWEGVQKNIPKGDLEIPTYEDHRMAMAFAPACLKTGELIIQNPQVVIKSYPGFWEEIKKLGFRLQCC